MLIRFILTSIVTFFYFQGLHAQQSDPIDRELEGFWRGALIRNGNSVQIIEADVFQDEDTFRITSEIPDWVYYSPRASKLIQKGDSLIFDTYYGTARMLLDTSYMEMIGTVGDKASAINIHLKKNLRPPEIEIFSEEIKIENREADISGTLFYPAVSNGQQLACAIIVHGRGCSIRAGKENRAQKLAEYGIATFVYDKRGSEPSNFPCEESTHDLNVSDVKKIVTTISKHPVTNPLKVGLISYSAGGWIAQEVGVESQVSVAFIITVVGPATSVLQQQLDGLEAFMKRDGASEKAIKEGKRYTELLFAQDNYDEVYVELQELLVKGKAAGWTKWLVEDDYVSSPDDFEKLWVQRFRYNPTGDIIAYPGPYLAIFGEDDFIVPYKKQIRRLDDLMSKTEKTNYKAIVIPKAGHGLEHGSLSRELIPNTTYFKFDRVAYGALQHIIDFLKSEDFIAE